MKRKLALGAVLLGALGAVLASRLGAAHDGDQAHNRKDADIAKITEELKDDPDNEKLLQVRSHLFLLQNEYEAGLKDLEHLLRLPLKPKFGEAVRALHGLALFRMANYKGALADLDPLCSASTTVPGAWFIRGELRRDAGDLAGARSDLDHGLGLAPTQYAHGRVVRASVRELQGDLAGARADLDKVLEVDPRDKEALLARALLLVESDWKQAKTDLDSVLGMPFATDDPTVRATEARLQRRRNGMITEVYGKALDLYEKDIKASRSAHRKAMLMLEAARLRHEMRDTWPALKQIRDALDLEPERVDANRLFVALLEQAKDASAETLADARKRLAAVEASHGVASVGSR